MLVTHSNEDITLRGNKLRGSNGGSRRRILGSESHGDLQDKSPWLPPRWMDGVDIRDSVLAEGGPPVGGKKGGEEERIGRDEERRRQPIEKWKGRRVSCKTRLANEFSAYRHAPHVVRYRCHESWICHRLNINIYVDIIVYVGVSGSIGNILKIAIWRVFS